MEFGVPQTRTKKNKMILIIAAVLVVLLAATAGFFFWKWQSTKSDPASQAQASSQRIIQKVGKLYALPGGEEPTVALVQDKEKLKSQSFFDKAQNGDYLLMYSKAKLALIYREKDNKLINVGPISINSDSTKQDQSATTPTSDESQTSPNRVP